jgi:hypothetical protein
MTGLDGVVVYAGTLILDGTLNESSVTVANGASFGGDGAIAAGGVSFGEGCTFVVRVDNGEPSCLDVSGAVTGSQFVVDATVLSGKWKEAQCVLKSGEAISAPFKRGEGIRSLELRNNATELWAMPKRDGFAVVIR